MTDLRHFFWPGSIAIIGASPDAGTLRGRILEFLLQRGYQGKLHLVSSSHAEIRGHKTVASIKEVKQAIDLVLVAVRADLTEAVIGEAADAGAKFAVCFSSGFAEEGEEGRRMQERLAALAKSRGIRICGPNTAGFFNVHGMVPVTFTRSVDARRPVEDLGKLESGTVGIVAQSGGLGFAQQHRCAVQHGLGFSYIVSTGNEADLESLDFVDYMIDDPKTKVILLLIEGLKNGPRLAQVAARAAAAGKPIVVSKFGRTDAGTRAASSHAGRLTGSNAGYDAAFRRHGLIRVEDEDDMVDLAAAFSRSPLPRGNRVAIVTTSGGAGVWMADACESAGLAVPLLDDETQRKLGAYVPSFGSTLNPVDMTAQVSLNPVQGEKGALSPLVGTLSTLADSPSVDAVILVANLSDGQVIMREREGLAALVKTLKKPVFLYTHALPSAASLQLIWELGLCCFGSTRRTARTLKNMHDYAQFLDSGGKAGAEPPRAGAPLSLPPALCEYEAKAILRDYGFAFPREALAKSADDAARIAAEFGAPVALKVQAREIQHKTEVGGVALNMAAPDAVRDAYARIVERAHRAEPGAQLHGVLVQEMSPKGLEVALGIVRDPDFGPMMMVGLGGIHIEVLKDVVFELLPVRKAKAREMLQRLRSHALLEGVRGEPARDIDALAQLMETLSRFVEATGEAVVELDLNPVFVHEAGQGLTIVDAVLSGAAAEEAHAPA